MRGAAKERLHPRVPPAGREVQRGPAVAVRGADRRAAGQEDLAGLRVPALGRFVQRGPAVAVLVADLGWK